MLAAIVIFLWEYLLIEPQTAWNEIIVESGCGGDLSFTASFPQISAIIPNNENPLIEEMLEEEHISVAVQILRQDGSLAGMAYGEDVPVHTNGYISTESCQLAGLPIALNVGEEYTLHYEAVYKETGLPNLSFALYGTPTKLWKFGRGIALAAALLCIVLFSLVWEEDRTARYIWFPIAWILLAIPYLWTMPLEQHDGEASHFARAYQLATAQKSTGNDLHSSENLTSVAETADILSAYTPVQVEESGLRNMAYLSYSVPLYRFWTDRQYGNVLTQGMTGSQFLTPSADLDPGILLRAAAIAAVRRFSFPYQAIYLSGALLTGIIAILWMILILSRLRADHKAVSLVMGIFLLPSFMRSIFYYSGNGILILSLILLVVLLNCKRKAAAAADTANRVKNAAGANKSISIILYIICAVLIAWYGISWALTDGRAFVQTIHENGLLSSAAEWAGNFGWYLDAVFLRLLYGTWTEKSHLMIPSVVYLWALWKLWTKRKISAAEVAVGSRNGGGAVSGATYVGAWNAENIEREPLSVIAVVSFLVSLQYFL